MSQKNRANMLADIVNNIYNNIINFITGQNAQDRFVNLLDSAPNILSDKDQANGYVGTNSANEILSIYYCEDIAAVDLFNKADTAILVPRKWYMVNNANSNTKKILVQAQTINTLYGGGFNAVTGEGGTYNINTGVFTAVTINATLSIDITNAALITAITNSTIQIGVKYRVLDATPGVVWVWGIDSNVISTQAALEGTWDGTTWTQGVWGSYDVGTNTFLAQGLIQTISKADFDNKITNSELVIGQQYIVQSAFTSTVFDGSPVWDVLCIAFSNNQVYGRAWSNAGNAWTDCDYDPSSPLVRLANLEGLTISPSTANAWGSQPVEWFSQIFVTVASGGDYYKVQISSDPSTLILTNVLNTTTGQFGTYDPATDTFVPYSGTYTPTLTEDGTVCTGVAGASAIYSSDGSILDISISCGATFDFSAGQQGTISYSLPFGTLASSKGVISVDINGNSPALPIFGYEKNGVIYVQCEDTALAPATFNIIINITVKIT